MKKMNKKGFMLVELLAVTIVILVIFTSIYINFPPSMGEYENRISYNDIDSMYANYYLKVFFLRYLNDDSIDGKETKKEEELYKAIESDGYFYVVQDGTCTRTFSFRDFTCDDIVKEFEISEAIITSYRIDKDKIKNMELNTTIEEIVKNNEMVKKYLNFLPDYSLTDEDGNSTEKLYRLSVRTKMTDYYGNVRIGYATDQLYTRNCNVNSYSLWSTWGEKPCSENENTCERKEMYLKENFNNGSMKPNDCDKNPLCLKSGNDYKIYSFCNEGETEGCTTKKTFYRTREIIGLTNDLENWTITPCDD